MSSATKPGSAAFPMPGIGVEIVDGAGDPETLANQLRERSSRTED